MSTETRGALPDCVETTVPCGFADCAIHGYPKKPPMPDTTKTGLTIPSAAVAALHEAGDAPLQDYVTAISAPVVAAELRRLAEVVAAADDRGRVTAADVYVALRARADEVERMGRAAAAADPEGAG